MALTGLEIYKLLAKTNCKECGFPTCLAFAMKLAQKGTELAKCPYVTDETRAALDAASAPPIRLITVGTGDRAFSVGNETVLFRHEKTFFHQTGLMVRLRDDDPALAQRAKAVNEYAIERVGLTLSLDGVALQNASGSASTFADAAAAVAAAGYAPIALLADDPDALSAAAERIATRKPLLGVATAATIAPMAAVAKARGCPLVVRGTGDLESLAALCGTARDAGVEDLVLDPGAGHPAAALALFTQLRRLAVKKNLRTLGYPLIAFAGGESLEAEAVAAAGAIAKYAGVLVVDHDDPALLYSLLTLRQNIYTDPQKPIQVEPGLYSIGAVTADSPLLITTNFSLTYFTVSGEIESGGTPAHLLVADADGQSVLTSWAAGKFDAEKIAKTVQQSGIGDRLSHRKLVIPGLVAGLSGETEEELPGWQIIVGPREAAEIPTYLKTVWPRL
jgi:acetyl-CoA decarbonylase/synthase, CODH/ACS complex subunit gamma